MEKTSLFKLSGLPEPFAVLLLSFFFILTLAPYFSGADFGSLFRIPVLSRGAKKWLKVIGPIALFGSVLSFVPLVSVTKSPITDSTHSEPSPLAKASPAAHPPAKSNCDLVKIELVRIPAGSFDMGSSEEEIKDVYNFVVSKGVSNHRPDLYNVERPKHRVTISQPFFMSKCEITIGQWKSLMGDLPEGMQAAGFPGILKEYDGQPVVSVRWNETQQFITKLNGQNDGHLYRLPSEAEWEYACRANIPGWYAGKPELLAWYGDNSGNDSHSDSLAAYGKDAAGYNQLLIDNENRSHIVGTTKQANAFGLYDMHGNVWEWCDDYWHENYGEPGIPIDGSVWRGDGDANLRVARGGSWKCGLNWIRSAVRQPYGLECSYGPSCRDIDLGFRVAAVPVSSQ